MEFRLTVPGADPASPGLRLRLMLSSDNGNTVVGIYFAGHPCCVASIQVATRHLAEALRKLGV